MEPNSVHMTSDKSRVRFEFLSVLAHELKAPINAVEGYLAMLRSGTLASDKELEIEILDRCTARIGGMRKLIDDLLDLTRIESGQRARHLTQLDLAALARWSIETARSEAERRNIEIRLNSPDPLHFTADRSEIEIMLNNLISNAVKYNREHGRVTVNIRREGRCVTLSVTDTGIGMTQAELESLFKEFVRIRNEKTQQVLGSGLGLSILRKLALLYEGNIDITSAPDQGSVFTVTLCEPELETPVMIAQGLGPGTDAGAPGG